MRRRGPLAAFFAFGFFSGAWAALIPAIQEAVGATKGELGLALLFVAIGSLPSMLVAGRELDRHGARLIPVLLTGLGIAAVLPHSPTGSRRSRPRSSRSAFSAARSTSRSTLPCRSSRCGRTRA